MDVAFSVVVVGGGVVFWLFFSSFSPPLIFNPKTPISYSRGSHVLTPRENQKSFRIIAPRHGGATKSQLAIKGGGEGENYAEEPKH